MLGVGLQGKAVEELSKEELGVGSSVEQRKFPTNQVQAMLNQIVKNFVEVCLILFAL